MPTNCKPIAVLTNISNIWKSVVRKTERLFYQK